MNASRLGPAMLRGIGRLGALAIGREPMAPRWATVLDALEQAVHDRRPGKGMGLVHHSYRGS